MPIIISKFFTHNHFDRSFWQPLDDAFAGCHRQIKEDLSLPDSDMLKLGVLRCLTPNDSGRHFLQDQADQGKELARANYFTAFHCPRRLEVIAAASRRLADLASRLLASTDCLAVSLPMLGQRPIWAIDGHQIAHACHALKDAKEAHTPSGSLYALDLRTRVLRALCPYQGGGRRIHELKALKRILPLFFGPKGTGRPILVVDMNFVDTYFWPLNRMKDLDAPDLITREKENMVAITAIPLPFDKNDPVNQGVLKHELVAYSSGLQMIRVTYFDPQWEEEKKPLVFICTDTALAPGVVATLYRLRWKIEKTFHTFKSKLHERKEWATGPIAQEIHTHLMAITHNLLTLLLDKLDREHGIKEEKLLKKHDKRAEERKATNSPHLVFYDIARKCLQLSHQFIRLVRNLITNRTPFKEALSLFRIRLYKYL
jgi:hypothetical protein